MDSNRGKTAVWAARFGAAGVAEGERTALADMPQDDVTQLPLMGIFMVGQVFGENLHFRNFTPLT